MDLTDSTDTTENFSRKLIASSTHNNISKLVTPQKAIQVRKSVKVALDEAEKHYSDNLMAETIQELSAKKQPPKTAPKSLLGAPRRTLYQEVDMSVLSETKIDDKTTDQEIVEVVKQPTSRKTQYDLNEMSVTGATGLLVKLGNSAGSLMRNARKTIFGSNDHMNLTREPEKSDAILDESVEQEKTVGGGQEDEPIIEVISECDSLF
jgi:hypothetical protein